MQPIAATTPRPAARPDSSVAWALRLLWLVCGLVVVTVAVGRTWDGWWHITQPFDDFWSPPHVFIYLMVTVTALVGGLLAAIPALRRQFGPDVPLAPLPLALPAPLFLLGAGFVALGLAGMVFDNLWHTAFGLDETAWSLPHNMIGVSLALLAFGLAACRLALRPRRRLRTRTALALGVLLLSTSAWFLGPLAQNNNRDTVAAVANIPMLAAQPPAQRSYMLQLAWNLTRENPALIVLGGLWAGWALALVRGLDRRAWVFVLIVALWTLMTTDERAAEWLDQFGPVSHDDASWLPLPLLPATLALLLGGRVGLSEGRSYVLAGLVFGVCTWLVWGTAGWSLLLALPAASATAVGARLGARVYRLLERPTPVSAWTLTLLVVGAVPLVTGAVDLALRLLTP